MEDLLDEDRELRESLAELSPGWRRELEDVLNAPQAYRDELLAQMIARPDLADLAQLLAMADTGKVIRLRLLRAIRDIDA
jgi:hypothetical protein